MKIIDNLLSEPDFDLIKKRLVYSNDLSWGWSPQKVFKDDGTDTLVSMIYQGHEPKQKDHFVTLYTLFNEVLDVVSWYRIKINCTWKRQEYRVYGYHQDYGKHSDERVKHAKTAIFYCTTTDGPTVFEDPHESVDCLENRLLIFNGSRKHSGTTHTEGNERRIVINFNYF